MTLIILWNIKEDILKYGVIFEHDIWKKVMQVKATWCWMMLNFPNNVFKHWLLQLAIKNINITILEAQVWGKNWPRSQNKNFCHKNPLNIHCLIISCVTLVDFYYKLLHWLLLVKCFTFDYCIYSIRLWLLSFLIKMFSWWLYKILWPTEMLIWL